MADGGICTGLVIANISSQKLVDGLLDTDGLLVLSLDEGRDELPLKIDNGINQRPRLRNFSKPCYYVMTRVLPSLLICSVQFSHSKTILLFLFSESKSRWLYDGVLCAAPYLLLFDCYSQSRTRTRYSAT